MILMLKIVSALNGSYVRQSVTTLGIELQLHLINIIFQKKNIIFQQNKSLIIILFFWKKLFFG